MGDLLLPIGGQQMSTYEELYREFLDDRTLFFNDEVGDNVVEDYVMYIIKWNKDDMDIPVDKRRPIRIYISSPGGSVFSANMLVDVIEASATPVWGIALDLVASAAFHVYLSCHMRFGMKNSTFLQHDGEIALENSRKKAKDTMKFFDEGEERLKKHVLSHTNMTEDYYDSVYADENWFYSDVAKELGVVHKIIGEDCELSDVL